MKKNIVGAIGFILIVGTLLSGIERLTLLLDWSTAELVGYNFTTLAFLIGGGWMIRYSLKKEIPKDKL